MAKIYFFANTKFWPLDVAKDQPNSSLAFFAVKNITHTYTLVGANKQLLSLSPVYENKFSNNRFASWRQRDLLLFIASSRLLFS